MRLSLLKIGLVLLVSGSVWIAVIFENNQRIQDETVLAQGTSFEIRSGFTGSDLGFYTVFMPGYSGEEIFVQVLDPAGNVLEEEKTQTRLSVGYFDYGENGIHAVKITNISKSPVHIRAELGDTNSGEMAPAGVLVLVGSVTLMMVSYFRLKNYSMAQPDENIS